MLGRLKTISVRTFFFRPVLPFALEVLLVVPLVLAPEVPALVPFYLIASPWLVVGLILLNLPVVALLLDGGLDPEPAIRRNHALEHATIHFLCRAGRDVVFGRAEKRGFRIFGRLTPSEIHSAFAEVAVRVQGGMAIPHISPDCGSNRITALALGVVLLGAVTALSLAFDLPVWTRVVALTAAIVAFFRWRDRMGNWIQGRFFMATDFDEVSIGHVHKLRGSNRGGRLLYFVQTRVA